MRRRSWSTGRANEKIEFVLDKVVDEVLGDDKVTGVRLRDTVTGEESELAADGVFVAIGHDPNTALFLDQLDHEPDSGYLLTREVDRDQRPGVFAAGDVQDHVYRQAVTAAAPAAPPRSTPSAGSASNGTLRPRPPPSRRRSRDPAARPSTLVAWARAGPIWSTRRWTRSSTRRRSRSIRTRWRCSRPRPATVAARPVLESHGAYVVAVLAVPHSTAGGSRGVPRARSAGDAVPGRHDPQVGDYVAASRPSRDWRPVEAGADCGSVIQAAVDDTADAFLELLDGLYEEIDELESRSRLSGC